MLDVSAQVRINCWKIQAWCSRQAVAAARWPWRHKASEQVESMATPRYLQQPLAHLAKFRVTQKLICYPSLFYFTNARLLQLFPHPVSRSHDSNVRLFTYENHDVTILILLFLLLGVSFPAGYHLLLLLLRRRRRRRRRRLLLPANSVQI